MGLISTCRKVFTKAKEVIRNATKVTNQAQRSKQAANDRESTIMNKGYYRSDSYICPANWFNHQSGTFLKNKRLGL